MRRILTSDWLQDCLYLNLWVPEEVLLSPGLSPVLAWIYGGGFMTGTSTLEVWDLEYYFTFFDGEYFSRYMMLTF